MDLQLSAMLASLEEGDFQVCGPLADYLEERGDPRAPLARSVMELDPPLIGQVLHGIRGAAAAGMSVATAAEATWLAANLFGVVAPVLALVGAVAAKDLASSRAVRTSPEMLIPEVEEAITSRKLTGDMAAAITMSRLVKRDRLLAALRDEDVDAQALIQAGRDSG
jgi:hypothetical protein